MMPVSPDDSIGASAQAMDGWQLLDLEAEITLSFLQNTLSATAVTFLVSAS